MSDDRRSGFLKRFATFRIRKRTRQTTRWLCRTSKKPWPYRSGGYRGARQRLPGLVVLFIFLGGTYLVSLLSWFFNWTLRALSVRDSVSSPSRPNGRFERYLQPELLWCNEHPAASKTT